MIPTLNESGGIASVIRAVRPYADEIMVLDGGSVDDTIDIARKAPDVRVLCLPPGKGLAIRAGLRETTCDIVVLIDADGSHEPRDIPRLIAPIRDGEAELVIASRVTGGSDEYDAGVSHTIRRIGAKVMIRIINVGYRSELTDALNGFRALRRGHVEQLALAAKGFEIELEVLTCSLAANLRVSEVPSREYARQWGVSKLSTARGIPMMFRLLTYVGRDVISRSSSRRAIRHGQMNGRGAGAAHPVDAQAVERRAVA